MNITPRQLKTQIDRAKRLGWLPFFEEAADLITPGFFDVADLLAIGSRETNLDPKWLTKPGDRGNGFGLMQADKRSFPEFTKGDGWKDARTGILFGAKVLMQKWADQEQSVGKRLTVKSSKGGSYTFTGRAAVGQIAQHVALSSYNCGRWALYAWANGQPIDKYSTGKDYGADVMERAGVIRSYLGQTISAVASTGGTAQSPTEDAPGETSPSDPTSTEQPPTPSPAALTDGESATAFKAYIPQIDTAKTWLRNLFAGTSIGTALAVGTGLPLWLQIGLFSLLGTIVIGGIVIFVKYHKQIFAYITNMNTVRATPGLHDPIVAGRPPTD